MKQKEKFLDEGGMATMAWGTKSCGIKGELPEFGLCRQANWHLKKGDDCHI